MTKAPWTIAIDKELERANPQWKEFIRHKLTNSEDRLLLLMSLSDKTKTLLQELSFTYASWFAHETSTGKDSGSVKFSYASHESGLYVTHIPGTQETTIRLENLTFEEKEELIVVNLFLEFDVIGLLNRCK